MATVAAIGQAESMPKRRPTLPVTIQAAGKRSVISIASAAASPISGFSQTSLTAPNATPATSRNAK